MEPAKASMWALWEPWSVRWKPSHRGSDRAMATPVEEICGRATPMNTSRRITRKTPTSGQAKPTSTLV